MGSRADLAGRIVSALENRGYRAIWEKIAGDWDRDYENTVLIDVLEDTGSGASILSTESTLLTVSAGIGIPNVTNETSLLYQAMGHGDTLHGMFVDNGLQLDERQYRVQQDQWGLTYDVEDGAILMARLTLTYWADLEEVSDDG